MRKVSRTEITTIDWDSDEAPLMDEEEMGEGTQEK
jgi:hypothetical protein